MGEVPWRAVRLVLDALEGTEISVDAVLAGFPVPLSELHDSARRIDWSVCVDLLTRLDTECAGRLALEEIGARILKVPSFRPLRLAGQLLMTPRSLYELARRVVAPSLFPNVVVETEWLESGRLVVTAELLPGYRASVPFFRICHGTAAALPCLLDLPASRIEEQALTGTRGRLVLLPPPSHTLASRARRSVRAVRACAEMLQGIRRQQTEFEASVDALRSSKHAMQMLIERLPDGVMLHNNGVVRWANAAAAEILGVASGADLVGRNVMEFVPPEDREELVAGMRRAATNELGDTRAEYRVLRPDGTMRRVHSGATQIVEFEGESVRMAVVRDVTEQHDLREQAAIADRMASLGALAAGVAHEINNPLAYTRLSLEIAERECSVLGYGRGTELKAALANAHEGTERVLGIVGSLRTFSRVHNEPVEAVDLPRLIDSTLALAERNVTAKARLVKNYGPAPFARAQRGKLGQVVLNLLINATDAIPDGAAKSHVIRVTTRTDTEGRAIVEVFDTGSGISPAIARRVFDPFFTTKPAGTGTGLGLAMCRRIMKELHGTIDFESVPGATTFRLTLPASAGARPAEEERRVNGKGKARRGRVLVVDDEPALLVTIRKLLADRHDVVTAKGVREALAHVEADDSFDVVIADLMMAEATGIDLYEAVRARHPALAPRFVFMTGGAFTSAAQNFLAQTQTRYLAKPFRSEELRRAVEEIVAQEP